MLVSGSRHPSFRACAARLSLALTLAAAGSGGCSLIVGGELVDQPMEGGGGQGGGDASTAAQSSAAQSSSGPGMVMCKEGTADCDGYLLNACEAKLLTDVKNCGACKHGCPIGDKCENGSCK